MKYYGCVQNAKLAYYCAIYAKYYVKKEIVYKTAHIVQP